MADAEYHRNWYHENKDRIRDRKNRLSSERRKSLLVRAFEYKASHGCADCGEDDPVVLDFDHDDVESKTKAISDMIRCGNSWKNILSEIKKCTVRCANCHRRRTAKQFGWDNIL